MHNLHVLQNSQFSHKIPENRQNRANYANYAKRAKIFLEDRPAISITSPRETRKIFSGKGSPEVISRKKPSAKYTKGKVKTTPKAFLKRSSGKPGGQNFVENDG